ncbi:MAG: heavy-metal-associated domain-containing protein [Chloroflexi bacterium]|nr:heavy-metal-associated domain-containing protein [Chloroflexota bacterium]
MTRRIGSREQSVAALRRYLSYVARIVDAPQVQADPADPGRLALRGVVCANRARAALMAVPEIEEVTVELHRSEARVRYAPGARANDETLQRALEGVVVGMTVRRWLEHVAHGLMRSAAGVARRSQSGTGDRRTRRTE